MELPKAKIKTDTPISIKRLLPVPGTIAVSRGQRVNAMDVVARANLSHRYQVLNITRQLGQPQVQMNEVMHKHKGDEVEAGEIIAALPGGIAFRQRAVRAPETGRIAAVGVGWILLETEQTVTEIRAFIDGVVSNIIPDWGVVIETQGTMIEAACGFGGETHGRLKRLVNSPYESLKSEDLDETAGNAIVVGGRTLSEVVLRRAEALQVRGIIVGSIDAALLNLKPPSAVSVVATEGFGDFSMSPYIFGVLTTLSRQKVSIRGQTPDLISPGRPKKVDPPLILATTGQMNQYRDPSKETDKTAELSVGSRVRVVYGDLLGANGKIESIPKTPQPTQTGIIAPGVFVTIEGHSHYIPRTNLEWLE